MDTNTYYTCKCIYFDTGFITCDVCSKLVIDKHENEPRLEPIIYAKRWSRFTNSNQKSKKIVFTNYIYLPANNNSKYTTLYN